MSDELREELDEPETGDAVVDPFADDASADADGSGDDVASGEAEGDGEAEDAGGTEADGDLGGPIGMPTAEENVYLAFDQHWTMLFCCVSIFTACIWLPMEARRPDLYASQAISGGFLTIFAAYGVLAQQANIKYRKMIVWPALFMALDGVYVGVMRAIQLIQAGADAEMSAKDIVRSIGPGTWVILFCSFLVFWTLLRGAAAGAKKDKERKEAARAARKR